MTAKAEEFLKKLESFGPPGSFLGDLLFEILTDESWFFFQNKDQERAGKLVELLTQLETLDLRGMVDEAVETLKELPKELKTTALESVDGYLDKIKKEPGTEFPVTVLLRVRVALSA